ncbi:helix-turn-helix domain-containing protein [Bosea sp. NPDC003192]|jgi:hypothetical protein|uniref:helix-turn-helix domain-containing protein n=1 Tax=Bosea sp. NPDC003192 TaxID=3390551 RepID=UPI003D01EB1E
MQLICNVISGYIGPEKGYAWPSLDRLAADLDWSPKTVQRAIAEAVQWGWLIKRPSRLSNQYEMSFSRKIRTDVVQRHRERIARLERHRGDADRNVSDYTGQDNSGLSEWSDLSIVDGNLRHAETDRRVHRSSLRSNPTDPVPRSIGVMLDDKIGRNNSLFEKQKKCSTEQIVLELGEGNFAEGQFLGEILGQKRVEYLQLRVEEVGIGAAREEIQYARLHAQQRSATKRTER